MKQETIAILCVLKTGGDFFISDVVKLQVMLEKYVTVPYTFYCLTDTNEDIPFTQIIPLLYDYKGWWSKIELFRTGLVEEDRIVYFDLDTVIVANIDDYFSLDFDFIGLRPFNPYRKTIKNYFASGIMSWRNNGLFNYCFSAFHYDEYTKKYVGDQDYLSHAVPQIGANFNYWQNVVPGIFSYKRHLRHREDWDDLGVRVICFHGRPRPHQVNIERFERIML